MPVICKDGGRPRVRMTADEAVLENPEDDTREEVPAEAARDGGDALQKALALAEEYRATLQRLKADFDNYRKRINQEQQRWRQAAVAELVLEVLPAVDNLERAAGAGGDLEAVRQGVGLTIRQLQAALETAGIRPFVALGQPFDPTRHEAVAHEAVPGVADGCVAEEYRRGYLISDQVLRPALVKVAQAATPTEQESGNDVSAKEGDESE